jgi:transcriptional regulator with XRE-family HTH domain
MAKSSLEKAIIKRVREKRQDLNMSQMDLSLKLGYSESFISNIESGAKKYNLNHLNKIALAFKCTLWDLIPERPLH